MRACDEQQRPRHREQRHAREDAAPFRGGPGVIEAHHRKIEPERAERQADLRQDEREGDDAEIVGGEEKEEDRQRHQGQRLLRDVDEGVEGALGNQRACRRRGRSVQVIEHAVVEP